MLVLLTGIISGFCSSAPLGPINLWLVQVTLQRQQRRLLPFLSGVVAVDAGFAVVAALGYRLSAGSLGPTFLGLAAGAVLVAIGIAQALPLLRPAPVAGEAAGAEKGPPSPWQDFVTGAFLCGANPAFILFWLTAINFAGDNWGIRVSGAGFSLLALGVIIGDVLWFTLLRVATERTLGARSDRTLRIVRLTIAGAFVACGLLSIAKTMGGW